ncbi:uncharacterized protein ACA1_383600 [Acanthamoeba castellanii str. Neff]|uniref:Intimal thickness related receptor IRP domain-containing protein n=1 Tax=Acanthamoeba castellanii (strain ATCC 30010 / Neff) TaxID=1257118 RepID=L8GV59_ACACF|nr:uncharacterized protein ACA1_383600 [Acanthamoeba castellanii str. Neff]ELR16827.1 hypothetical protein ACA1_383600 [Acanthamoeba castellanii str. Neff]
MRGAGLLVAAGCALVFLLLSGQVGPAEATRDTWDDNFRDNLYFIDRFAFKEDGTWNVQIDPLQKGALLRLLVCNDDDYGDMIDGYSTSDGKDVCNKIAQNKSKCAVHQFKGFANMTGVAKTRDMYWFVLVNCNQTKLNVEFYEVFLNPGGEYLGWDTIPLPYIYGILIIVYAVLLLAWLGNIVFIDKGAGSNRLHKYISLWPIMKLWLVIFNTAYWGYISERGVMTWGIDVIYVIYNSLWYSYFFGGLLLVGLAWGISRKGMGWFEALIFCAVQIVFYITWVINFALEGYYAVVSIFGLGCMLIVIFFFTSFSIKNVNKAIQNSQSVGPAQASSSAGGLVWALLYAGLFHYHTWAYRMLNEASELALVIMLGRNLYFEFNDDALGTCGRPQHAAGIEMDTLPDRERSNASTFHNPERNEFDASDDELPVMTYPMASESRADRFPEDDLPVMTFPIPHAQSESERKGW